ILMTADFADIHNPGYGTHAVLSGSGKMSAIKNWVDSRTRIEWMFNLTEAGTYKIEALIKAEKNCSLNIKVGEQEIHSEINSTGDKYDVVNLGEIQFSETGDKTIAITPDRENWNEIELMYIELIKK
ncbi:MAG TPA: DUF5077 domain-containing protein, partial [Draconibacterium sp.]|nr:DUF5077 domain-containing protein [Draconibacterium sp.]